MVIPGCRFIMDKKRSVKLTLEKVSNRQRVKSPMMETEIQMVIQQTF